MFTAALAGLVDRFDLRGQRLGAVVGGAVLKHSRDFNLMRECVLGSELSPYTAACDLQQACGTGLQAAIAAADGIAAGRYEVAAAGGVDTTSDPPIGLVRTCAALCQAASGQVQRAQAAPGGWAAGQSGSRDPGQQRAPDRAVDGRSRRHHRQADGYQTR